VSSGAASGRSSKEIVLAALALIYSTEAMRAIDAYHDDVDFIGYAPVEFFPQMGARRGKAAAMEMLAALRDSYTQMRHEVEFIAADGDDVAVILRLHMQKTNGRIVQIQDASFFKLRDGLIVQQRQFIDSFDALQQILEVDLTEVVARGQLGK